MDGYAFIASLVGSLASVAWPAAAFGCFFLVRREVSALMPKLRVRVGDNELSFISELVQKTQEETVEMMIERPSTVLENLSELSTQHLKLRVSEFCGEIRRWDIERRTKRDAILHNRHNDVSWSEFTENLLSNSTEENHAWRSRYQSTALAIKSELLRRLGDTHGLDTSHGDVAIEHGVLAGVSPVTDAANFLEALARRLV